MKTSEEGVDFIKQWETLRLNAYDDGYGYLTIGYGHTGPDVHRDLTIDEEVAEQLLEDDLHDAEVAVEDYVDVELQQHEFDALVSFVFNVGSGNFSNSSMLKLLNNGDRYAAALQFARWNKSGGKVSNGLIRRRKAEQRLFEGLA